MASILAPTTLSFLNRLKAIDYKVAMEYLKVGNITQEVVVNKQINSPSDQDIPMHTLVMQK